jgi:nicotinamidase-related amidase
MDALLIVDFQYDFVPGGALAVEGGDQIAEPIQSLAPEFELIVATRDWHPPDHASFESEGGPWPTHCVAGSRGAQLHHSLNRIEIDYVIDVGIERDDEGYSGFENSNLAAGLHERGVGRVVVCGLATDYCVRATAIDACHEGFEVVVVEDAIRPVELEPGDGQRAIDLMIKAGATVATSEQLLTTRRAAREARR